MPGILQPEDGWDGSGGDTGAGGSDTGTTPVTYSDPVTPETGTLQMLLSEGEVQGLVNGLKSVFLDSTPIQNSDGSMNFKGIALALVAGTNTQAAVKGLTGSENPVSVNVQATFAAPVTRTISSNPSAIRVRVAIPMLKIVDTTTGNSTGHMVQVKIERQNASYNGGAWEQVQLENNGQIGGGPFSTKFVKGFRVDLPPSGTSWQVRLSRLSTDDADAYHMSQTWWEDYTEIVDARLRYPNSCVLSLRVNGKQFKSIPRVAADLYGIKIQVPTNYTPASQNPTTGVWTAASYATTGPGTSGGAWDGTFKTVWSSNPAWVFYDAAVKVRYGAGSFLSASGLDKWTLYAIAQWCDAMVADGKGGNEPRMVCNLYMQNSVNAIKALQQLASIFWGVVFYASGVVSPVADTDASPSALFTNANVVDGRFSYEGTARTARHTAAICTFINPELGWAADTAVYEDVAGIARYGYNPLDLTALGATSQGQALRLAKWAILTELLAAETVSFSSGLEGSVCRPGDVIQVSDQFRAGHVRTGGRVLVGATTTAIPLDGDVTLGAGTYYLKIKNSAGAVESRIVSTAAGTAQVLTVGTAFSEAPAAGATWVLQDGTTAALYRVLSVRKGEGLVHDVVALLHDPSKYTLLNLTTGDVIPRPGDTPTIPAPVGLSAICTQRILADRQVLTIEASWTLDAALSYVAEASRDYGPWTPMTVSGASAVLEGVAPGAWRVRVSGVWRAGQSPATETTVTVSSSATVPGFVDSVKKGDIATPNYVPGTSTTMATGAKMAAVPFTATLLDGTTISAQAEFGGAVVIAGRKAATIANRVFGNVFEVTTPGAGTWTCPEGITSVTLLLGGAGSSGSTGVINSRGGGGGASGEFKKITIAVVPGTTYNYNVGAGGAAVSTANTAGNAGGSTTFDVYTVAGGSAPNAAGDGAAAPNGTNPASGVTLTAPTAPAQGSGTDASAAAYAVTFDQGTASSGAPGGGGATIGAGNPKAGSGGPCIDFKGGNGANPTNAVGPGGGGGASPLAPGGAGSSGPGAGAAGQKGSGGGGGGCTTTATSSSGKGGDGYLRISY